MSPLQPGTPVPPLKLRTQGGGPFDQAATLGSPTIFYFMRATTCGICLGHVQAIARKLGAEYPDVKVFVVVPEDPEAAQKLVRRVPFPVLSGADGSYEAVGLGKRFGVVQGSGTLLLEQQGRVAFFKPGTLPTQAYDEAGLFRVLRELTRGGV